MKKQEYENIEKYAHGLESNQSMKCRMETAHAQSFYQGYVQAINDMMKIMIDENDEEKLDKKEE